MSAEEQKVFSLRIPFLWGYEAASHPRRFVRTLIPRLQGSLGIWVSVYPLMQCHTSERRNPQLNQSENLKIRKITISVRCRHYCHFSLLFSNRLTFPHSRSIYRLHTIVLYCTVVESRRLMPLDALQPKAYCTNPGLSRFYLHRQMSPPATLVVEGVTTWERNDRWILPENARLPRNIQGTFTRRTSTT